ncbi:cadmium-translocating P-type ATPase [Eubacteriales bacterium OttesenSCG-928-N14]|nr:cadmium-translocating P-type ATPase [Eubacteriales bacterium OttesenSCG-928-N14]
MLWRLGVGVVLLALSLLLQLSPTMQLILSLGSYLIIGGDVLLQAARNILRGKVFDENFLMSIATVGAFVLGEYAEGIAVMLFYQVGELFQNLAVYRSRKSITDLMDIRPDYANLMQDGQMITVSPQQVAVGQSIVIKPGERIPLDGVITEGNTTIDTSAISGESVPRDAAVGDAVISGSINLTGVVTVEVQKEFAESTVAKILDLVQNATANKAQSEAFITRFSRYYTPAVVLFAALLAVIPPLVTGTAFSEWVYRALVFLVISCPCALVISVPLTFFGGLGGASRKGIMIKGSNYLEALAKTDVVVFDKTGTLTKGIFAVTHVVPNGISSQELLRLAAHVESYSNHPISLSIQQAYAKPVDLQAIEAYEEIAGHGVAALVEHKRIYAGNAKLMQAKGIEVAQPEEIGTVIHIGSEAGYLGYLIIADEIKPDAKQAIAALKQNGVTKTVMLSGDNTKVAQAIATQLGIDEVHAELLPQDKVAEVEALMAAHTTGGTLAFVGDGINDAPVLARADIGIAMGGMGSDAAIEAADVVIMTDEPSKIVVAKKQAKRSLRIVKQNIIFALGVKLIVLALGALGFAGMWQAVFADVGVSLLAILNAIRALNVNNITAD